VLIWHATGIAALTFVVPGVPLSFACAGAAFYFVTQRRAAITATRTQASKLLRALWIFGAFALGLMLLVDLRSADAGASLPWGQMWRWVLPVADPIGSSWGAPLWVPLWYLRCYLWLLALAPLTVRLFRGAPRTTVLGVASLGVLSAVVWHDHWNVAEFGLYGAWWVGGYALASGRVEALGWRKLATLGAGSAIAVVIWVVASPPPLWIVNARPLLHSLVALAWFYTMAATASFWRRVAARPSAHRILRGWNSSALHVFVWHGAVLLVADRILGWHLDGGIWAQLGRVALLAPLPWLIAVLRRPVLEPHTPRLRLTTAAATSVAIGLAAILVIAPDAGARPAPPLSGQAIQAVAHQVTGSIELTERRIPISGPPVTPDELQKVLDRWTAAPDVAGVSVTVMRSDGSEWNGSSVSGTSDFDPARPAAIASVTKLFTAVALLQALESADATVNTSIRAIAPDLDLPDISVSDLLRHKSGYSAIAGPPDQVLAEALQQHPSGGPISYAGTNYVIAGMLLHQLVGAPFADIVRERIIAPLGLAETDFDERFSPTEANHAPDGSAYYGEGWSSSGLWSTSADLARFGLALYDGDLLTPESRAELLRFEDGYLGIAVVPFCPCDDDGLGNRRADTVAVVGNTSMISYSPVDDTIVAVVMPNMWPSTDGDEPSWNVLDRAIRDVVGGRPLSTDSASIAAD
jgi:CubicO group peptidase (beta-lactamase class C family)